jgi:formiminotetrahydrofolate cyclodeaminase
MPKSLSERPEKKKKRESRGWFSVLIGLESMSKLRSHVVETVVTQLCAKVPTPGGGAAAAVAASLGAASGSMASIYTTRKKDEASGIAETARALAQQLENAANECLEIADRDAQAYAALQSTWKKDSGLSPERVAEIQATALEVPASLVRLCHAQASSVHGFMGKCNPGIISDAWVSIHLLAGAGRAAYQTVLVNKPDGVLQDEMRKLLQDLQDFEADAPKSA